MTFTKTGDTPPTPCSLCGIPGNHGCLGFREGPWNVVRKSELDAALADAERWKALSVHHATISEEIKMFQTICWATIDQLTALLSSVVNAKGGEGFGAYSPSACAWCGCCLYDYEDEPVTHEDDCEWAAAKRYLDRAKI